MKAEISMPQTMRQITLEAVVIGVRRAKLRIWLGCKLLMFAAWIMGCAIEVEMKS